MVTNTVKNPNILISILLGVIFLLLAAIGYMNFTGSTTRAMNTVSPGTLVLRQIRDLSELTTAVFEMETVVPTSDSNRITESKLLYIAHGSVRVGINLKDLDSDNVRVEDDTITVTLPPLKILDGKIDLDHSSVYSYDQGFIFLGPDVIPLVSKAQREALNKIKNAACQDWLIQAANERVQKTIEQLLTQTLKNTQYHEIVVNIPASTEVSCTL
jgi:hypothetical protein